MPEITEYISRPAVFEPEAISVMGDAYERALTIPSTPASEDVRQMIAARIIELVRAGERDPLKLCEQSLAGLGRSYLGRLRDY